MGNKRRDGIAQFKKEEKKGKIIIYSVAEIGAYSGEGWTSGGGRRAINLSFTGRNSKL